MHKLCDVLNQLGHLAYLYPAITARLSTPGSRVKTLLAGLRDDLGAFLATRFKRYRTHPAYNTPVLTSLAEVRNNPDWIVIYPEIIDGNPAQARNVVRWLLHQPGFHTGRVCYGSGELYYKFNDAIKPFQIAGSTTAQDHLKVVSYPLEHYNMADMASGRSGTAYCIRKGKGKKIVHDLVNSTLIDGMSHAQTAAVLKRVERFISYDTYTAYSIFAVLCGCESVVVPDEGVSAEQWYPDVKNRYGIAYGFDQLGWAAKTRDKQIQQIAAEHGQSVAAVERFAKEAIAHFELAQPTININR